MNIKMRMKVYDTVEGKNESNLPLFLVACLLGVVIFFILLGTFKGGIFLIKLVFGFLRDYWIFILLGIGFLLIAKRVLFRRRLTKRDAMQEPQM